MFDREPDKFLQKFYQLKKAGLSAHLDLDTHAGEAWVGIRVRLRHEPGPLHQPRIQSKRQRLYVIKDNSNLLSKIKI